MNKSFKSPVVILANGAFPISKIPLDQLKSAGTVICTDGSANNLSTLGLTPHVIIGDLDSIDSCLLYTSPSPRDRTRSRMPSSA